MTLKEEWEKIIKEFKESSKSQAQFCRDNNLKFKVFNYHYRRDRGMLKKTQEVKRQNDHVENQINWVPVKLEAISPVKLETVSPAKLNIKIGKAIIEIESGFDEKLLQSVIRSLEGIC